MVSKKKAARERKKKAAREREKKGSAGRREVFKARQHRNGKNTAREEDTGKTHKNEHGLKK
jgi:hypothetical protein